MADQFKEYSGSDKAAIIDSLKSKFTGFNMKELLLVVAAVALCVMVIILGAFVGVEKQKATIAQAQVAQLRTVCQDKMCLEAAAWSIANVNSSVSPCDNFYQYACGNYKTLKPLDANTLYHSVLHDMYKRNEDKIVYLLESPVKRKDWASEKKLKDLFMSCTDQYSREKLRGKPLVDLVNSKLGGWSVLGTWNPSAWNFNVVLKKVQDDLWANAFWTYYIIYDWHDRGKYTLGLYPSGTGRYVRWNYFINPKTQKVRDDYKKFMRRVAQLLQRDANTTSMTDAQKAQKVDEFVNDAFTMEQTIARTASTSRFLPRATAPENRITLASLKAQTGDVIDFVEVTTYMFGGNIVNAQTPVVVYNFEYLKNITNMIRQLPPASKHRMLQNYLVWRVVHSYVQDLSWEYVHANRQVYVDITGNTQFLGLWRYCFHWASAQMKDALGALFVMDHFEDKDKQKVTDITEKLKLALENSISSSPWMDSATKKVALAKAKAVTYKLGYPDDLVNQQAVDAIYTSLSVNRSDYIGNVLRMNQFRKAYFKRLMSQGEDRGDWYFRTFDTSMAILFYWNEIIVPAGFFQFPLYDYKLPHYITFGSMGSIVGHFIVHVVDEYGRNWDKDGMYVASKNWWSNATRTAFVDVRQCMVDFYTNKTQGPFISPSGDPVTYPLNAERTATENLAVTSGVRLAYKAYQLWEKQHGRDGMIPGLGHSNYQMFFLSFAQGYCSDRAQAYLTRQAVYGSLTDETRINMALQELPEFSAAFSCPSGSNMNPTTKCQLY